MTYTKKTESRRHLYIEYPVFGENFPLLTRFTDEVTRIVREKSDSDPESKYFLTFSAKEEDGAVTAKHTLTVRKKSGEVIKRAFIAKYKDGYIKKFEEV